MIGLTVLGALVADAAGAGRSVTAAGAAAAAAIVVCGPALSAAARRRTGRSTSAL